MNNKGLVDLSWALDILHEHQVCIELGMEKNCYHTVTQLKAAVKEVLKKQGQTG